MFHGTRRSQLPEQQLAGIIEREVISPVQVSPRIALIEFRRLAGDSLGYCARGACGSVLGGRGRDRRGVSRGEELPPRRLLRSAPPTGPTILGIDRTIDDSWSADGQIGRNI
ncbi:hypothetical protein KM043_001740 [Ampulex compressa]|nr:hypothetical protein KM043_001740 [Ampulex compressa]